TNLDREYFKALQELTDSQTERMKNGNMGVDDIDKELEELKRKFEGSLRKKENEVSAAAAKSNELFNLNFSLPDPSRTYESVQRQWQLQNWIFIMLPSALALAAFALLAGLVLRLLQ